MSTPVPVPSPLPRIPGLADWQRTDLELVIGDQRFPGAGLKSRRLILNKAAAASARLAGDTLHLDVAPGDAEWVLAPAVAFDAPNRPAAADPASRDLLALAARLIKFRRERENLFPPGLFVDPAWDIRLTLVAARLDGSDVSVSSLCMAAGVPPSTGLRWVGNLIEQGMLERQPDPQDARRILIVLAEPVFEPMLDWLQRSSSAA